MRFEVKVNDLVPARHKRQMIIDRLEKIGLRVDIYRTDEYALKITGTTNKMEEYLDKTKKSIVAVGTGSFRNYSGAVIPSMELKPMMEAIDKKYGTNLIDEYDDKLRILERLYNN